MSEAFPHEKFSPVRCPARARPGRIDLHPLSFYALILVAVICGAIIG